MCAHVILIIERRRIDDIAPRFRIGIHTRRVNHRRYAEFAISAVGIGHLMAREDAAASPVGRRPVMATRASRPAGRRSLTVFSPLFFSLARCTNAFLCEASPPPPPPPPSSSSSSYRRPSSLRLSAVRSSHSARLPIVRPRRRITRIVHENCRTSPVSLAPGISGAWVWHLVATRDRRFARRHRPPARASLFLFMLSAF